MTFTRISTLAQNNFTLAQLANLQVSIADRSVQISSGMVARRYAGIATGARELVSLESVLVGTRTFLSNNNLVDSRLGVMEATTSSIFDIATDMRTTLIQALNASNVDEIDLPNMAKTMLDQIANLLNTQQDGRFLFAGSRSNTAPIDFTDVQFTTPPATYPSSSFSAQEAGTGVNTLASQGFAIAYDPAIATSGEAYRLDYNTAGEVLTITDLSSGAAPVSVPIAAFLDAAASGGAGANLAGTETAAIAFASLGITVTLDASFDRTTSNLSTAVMDSTANGSASFTNGTGYIHDSNGGVDNDTLSALLALDASVYDPATGLLTVTVDNSTPGEVHFRAAGIDFGAGIGLPSADLVTGGAVTVDVIVGGDVIGQITPGTVTTGGTTNGTLTINAGDLLFGQTRAAYYQGNSTVLSTRADTDTTVSYGITADHPGFEQLIRSLNLIATNPSNDIPRLDEAQRLITNAISEIPNIVSRIGLSRASLSNISEMHLDSEIRLEASISDIKHVDIAETLINLQADQAALEASFAVLSEIRNVSLINFL